MPKSSIRNRPRWTSSGTGGAFSSTIFGGAQTLVSDCASPSLAPTTVDDVSSPLVWMSDHMSPTHNSSSSGSNNTMTSTPRQVSFEDAKEEAARPSSSSSPSNGDSDTTMVQQDVTTKDSDVVNCTAGDHSSNSNSSSMKENQFRRKRSLLVRPTTSLSRRSCQVSGC